MATVQDPTPERIAAKLRTEAEHLYSLADDVHHLFVVLGLLPGVLSLITGLLESSDALICSAIIGAALGGVIGHVLGNAVRSFLKVFALQARK